MTRTWTLSLVAIADVKSVLELVFLMLDLTFDAGVKADVEVSSP